MWFKVDDQFWCHPKVLRCSPEAIALWVRAGSYCSAQLTDGVLTDSARTLFGQDWDTCATELVEAGLWDRIDGGYQFHDWKDFQPRSSTVKEKRAADRQRKAAARASKKKSREGIRADSARTNCGIRQESALPVPVPNINNREPQSTPESGTKTPFPEGWKPNKNHIQKIQAAGMDPAFEAEQFELKAKASGWRYEKWDLAFHSWINNAIKWRGEKKQPAAQEQKTVWDLVPKVGSGVNLDDY